VDSSGAYFSKTYKGFTTRNAILKLTLHTERWIIQPHLTRKYKCERVTQHHSL
jgi:hypothetical protein